MKTILACLLLLAVAAAAAPTASAALEAPAPPCTVNQSNDTVCHVEAAKCEADAYMYDMEDALNHYSADCLCAHYDNYGRPALRVNCDVPVASSAAADPASPCTTGIAQTWCDLTVGPCDVRVTPWTAWGDVYAWADCRGGSMTRCYAEVHTDGPTVERWCAF